MFDPGRESEIVALGRTWRVGRATIGALEEFRDWVKPQLSDPFDGPSKLINKVSDAVAREILKDCIDRRDRQDALDIFDPIVHQFRGTPRGMMQQFWILMKPHHPDITLATVGEILVEIGVIETKRIAEAAAGKSEGNAEGAPAAQASAPTGGNSTAPSSTAAPG